MDSTGQKKFKVMLTALTVLVLGAALLLPGTVLAKDQGVSKDTVVIGSISPLTGPIAMVGVSIANGAKDYFNYVNENGGSTAARSSSSLRTASTSRPRPRPP